MLSVRKIRSYDEDFDVGEFAERAVEVYREAHEALTRRDKAALHANVTGGFGMGMGWVSGGGGGGMRRGLDGTRWHISTRFFQNDTSRYSSIFRKREKRF